MTDQERLEFDRLDAYVAEGRLIRNAWTGTDAQGRETACLLAALYPPAGEHESAGECPAALMPPWLAHLTVWIDDNGTVEKWPSHIQRYATCIRGVVALDAEALDALSRRIRVLIVREAVSHVTVDEWGVRHACERTIAALESGDEDKIAAARSAASGAARAAVGATVGATVRTATYAASRTAYAAIYAATDGEATGVAAYAATDAAFAAARADVFAASGAAADPMIDGFLAAMEQAVCK